MTSKSSYINCCFAEKFTKPPPNPTPIGEFLFDPANDEIKLTQGIVRFLDENFVRTSSCPSIDLADGFDEAKVDMGVSYLYQTLLLIQKMRFGRPNLRSVLMGADVVVPIDILLMMASSWYDVSKLGLGWRFKAVMYQGIVFVDLIDVLDFTAPAPTKMVYNMKLAKYCSNKFRSIVTKPKSHPLLTDSKNVRTGSVFTYEFPSTKKYRSLKYFYTSDVDGIDSNDKYVAVKTMCQNKDANFQKRGTGLNKVSTHPRFYCKAAKWYYHSTFINGDSLVVGLKNQRSETLAGIEVIDRREMRRDLGRSFSPIFGLQIVHMVISQTRNLLLSNPDRAVLVERKSDELDVRFDVVDADLHPVISEEFKKLFPADL